MTIEVCKGMPNYKPIAVRREGGWERKIIE